MALILFYFREEPKTIDRFCHLWNKLAFALEFEGKFKTKLINFG